MAGRCCQLMSRGRDGKGRGEERWNEVGGFGSKMVELNEFHVSLGRRRGEEKKVGNLTGKADRY